MGLAQPFALEQILGKDPPYSSRPEKSLVYDYYGLDKRGAYKTEGTRAEPTEELGQSMESSRPLRSPNSLKPEGSSIHGYYGSDKGRTYETETACAARTEKKEEIIGGRSRLKLPTGDYKRINALNLETGFHIRTGEQIAREERKALMAESQEEFENYLRKRKESLPRADSGKNDSRGLNTIAKLDRGDEKPELHLSTSFPKNSALGSSPTDQWYSRCRCNKGQKSRQPQAPIVQPEWRNSFLCTPIPMELLGDDYVGAGRDYAPGCEWPQLERETRGGQGSATRRKEHRDDRPEHDEIEDRHRTPMETPETEQASSKPEEEEEELIDAGELAESVRDVTEEYKKDPSEFSESEDDSEEDDFPVFIHYTPRALLRDREVLESTVNGAQIQTRAQCEESQMVRLSEGQEVQEAYFRNAQLPEEIHSRLRFHSGPREYRWAQTLTREDVEWVRRYGMDLRFTGRGGAHRHEVYGRHERRVSEMGDPVTDDLSRQMTGMLRYTAHTRGYR